MADDKEKSPAKRSEAEGGKVKVMPKKDWLLHSPPLVEMQQLKNGVEALVHPKLIDALKTEKVID